ncbi:hypothetical protein ACWENQ_09985 [Nonomuraea sp. NPDC004354]
MRNATASMVSNWLSGQRQLTKGTRLPGVEDMRDIVTALEVSGDRADRLLAIGERIDDLRGALEKTGRGWRQNAAGRIASAATGSPDAPPPSADAPPSAVSPDPLTVTVRSTVDATTAPAGAAVDATTAAVGSTIDFTTAAMGSAVDATTAAVGPVVGSTAATVGSMAGSPTSPPVAGALSAAPPSVAASSGGAPVSVTASIAAAPPRAAGTWQPDVRDARAVPVDTRDVGVLADPERNHGDGTGGRGRTPRTVPVTHAALAAVVLAGLAFYGGTLVGGTDRRAGEGTERCGAWTHAGQGVRLQPCIKVSDETLMVRTRLRGPVGIKTDMAVQLYDPMTELPVSQQLKCHQMYITVEGQVQSCGYFAVRTLSGRDYAARSSWKIENGPAFIGEVLSPTLRW